MRIRVLQSEAFGAKSAAVCDLLENISANKHRWSKYGTIWTWLHLGAGSCNASLSTSLILENFYTKQSIIKKKKVRWQGQWKGWSYSQRRCPRGDPSPGLCSQVGCGTPEDGAAHSSPALGTKNHGREVILASSPGRPGACGWVREGLARPFSVQGTVWQTQPCPAVGTVGAAQHSQPVWGAYEYADRGQSWLAATPPSPTPPPPPQLRCLEKRLLQSDHLSPCASSILRIRKPIQHQNMASRLCTKEWLRGFSFE